MSDQKWLVDSRRGEFGYNVKVNGTAMRHVIAARPDAVLAYTPLIWGPNGTICYTPCLPPCTCDWDDPGIHCRARIVKGDVTVEKVG